MMHLTIVDRLMALTDIAFCVVYLDCNLTLSSIAFQMNNHRRGGGAIIAWNPGQLGPWTFRPRTFRHGQLGPRTTRPLDNWSHGQFGPWTNRPMDISAPNNFILKLINAITPFYIVKLPKGFSPKKSKPTLVSVGFQSKTHAHL